MPLIKLNNRSIKDVTSLPFGVGTLVHIQSQTASNSASISFTTGINSTYKEYQFYFYDIHPRTDAGTFNFNLSSDSGSNYNVTKTSTCFYNYHNEADSATGFAYQGAYDLAQSTAYQPIAYSATGADESCVGTLSLFNPSSTTYVKHFISTSNGYSVNTIECYGLYIAGYGNTTSAINAVRFQMTTGNFDGTIAMFGVL
jgi:hypothetical protein